MHALNQLSSPVAADGDKAWAIYDEQMAVYGGLMATASVEVDSAKDIDYVLTNNASSKTHVYGQCDCLGCA